jgi:site-specific recombinase XerD
MSYSLFGDRAEDSVTESSTSARSGVPDPRVAEVVVSAAPVSSDDEGAFRPNCDCADYFSEPGSDSTVSVEDLDVLGLPPRTEDSRADRRGGRHGTPVPKGGGGFALAVRRSQREAIREYQFEGLAPRTWEAYQGDFAMFQAWCDANELSALPASPETVAAYIAFSANLVEQETRAAYYAPATLSRWLAAINKFHQLAGLSSPTAHPQVRLLIEGIRRKSDHRTRRAEPIVADLLRQMLEEIDYTTIPKAIGGTRNAALLTFAYAGAFRGSEVIGLDVRDVSLHQPDGLRVLLRRSKTDQRGEGHVKPLPYGRDPLTCPVCAYARWVKVLVTATTAPGKLRRVIDSIDRNAHICRDPLPELAQLPKKSPLFRPVFRSGRVADRRLARSTVSDVFKAMVAATGADPAAYSSHSGRAGFVTQALRAGATLPEVMLQTGHRNEATVLIYRREHNPLIGNAVTKIGL